MKKIYALMAAVLFAAGTFAASYGIMINGTDYHAGELNSTPGDASFTEYMILGVQVSEGATLQLWDQDNNAGWAVDLDGASTTKIVKDGDHYACNTTGCYDFYIKLKYGEDQLYIGETECGGGQGGENPGGQGGQGGSSDAYWYWKGYVDGQNINNEIDGGIFDCGISSIEVAQDGYIFVVYQVHGVPGVQYMSAAYVDGPTHATMTTTGVEKLHVPAGNYTLYLYDNGDGTVELAYEAMSGKALKDCDESLSVQNTVVAEKAQKTIIDGQLRIVVGEKVYDATGHQMK